MIDIDLFWSYVELWIAVNSYTWERLAKDVDISRSTLRRMRRRVGGSEINLVQFNAICTGIGLIPEMTILHNENYGKTMLLQVRETENHDL